MTPENLTRKLLRAHLIDGELVAGTDIVVHPNQILLEDATATMAGMQFEMLGLDEIAVPLAVLYVDHNALQIDDKNMQDHRYLRSFAQRYGLRYSPPGNGISHSIHLERFGRPGDLLVGADSHTTTAGALGMFAVGAGGLEVGVAMAGYGFELACPRVTGVGLTGRLPRAVEAKDIILELLRRHGVRGGRGTVFEFFGEAVSTLSVTARATICNMAMETGATTAVFPADEQTRAWLFAQNRPEDFRPLSADDGADYDAVEHIDLGALEPLVALPRSPGNVVPVAEAAGIEVVQVCVGSSVNSSYEDLATVAATLGDRQVAAGVQLTVTPGSRQILDTIVRAGVYQGLLAAGARILEPICGPCIGIGQAPIKGGASVRTFNRNFPGRSGTAEDLVYLCSPSTAAVTALTGTLTDPRTITPPSLPAPVPPDTAIGDRLLTGVLPTKQRRAVEIERGENLVPPAQPPPLPDDLDGPVTIVVGDDISTGDMAPDGAIGMAVWSDIAACARFMFRRLDPDFHDRAQAWSGGFIVGGENYGQGSSREHAALAAVHLGIRAVIARSYARIHRRNLIAVGIPPLLFADTEPDPAPGIGQQWHIPGIRDAIADERPTVTATVDGTARVGLEIQLSPSERQVLLDGGLIPHIRRGGRGAVPAEHRPASSGP